MREYINKDRRNDRFVKKYYAVKAENEKLFKRIKELEKCLDLREKEE